jgi:putative nucleotidyltransferase with HDIG domain
MKAVRILYRLSQFWRTLFPKTDSASLAEAQHQLTPVQRRLFGQLQPSEQKHALSIWRKLRDLGEDQPDLLVAALLHDVGKLHYPLHLWERVLVVLVRAVMPAQAVRWGSLPSNDWKRLPAWRKAFILAEQHAQWGAELAHNAGVSPLTEYLIREHHHPQEQDINEAKSSLLHKLWLADNGS